MKKFFILLFMQIAICCTTFATNYLTFTAEEDNSSFWIVENDINWNIFYSLDNGETWKQLTNEPVSLSKGDRALLKGEEPDKKPSWTSYLNFSMTGLIAASGSVMSLVDGNGEGKTIPYDYCFYSLFQDCTSLTQAPELPATQLAERCYQCMFLKCENLKQAPELPATQLTQSCYQGMFMGCSSLTKAPELPATTLANNCYQYMFEDCESLTQAPELPAPKLEKACYSFMFYGCKNLSRIKVAFTDWGFSSPYTYSWTDNVAKNGTFICPKNLPKIYGETHIPDGWTVIQEEDSSTEAVAATEGTMVHTSGLTIFVRNADADIEIYEVGGKLIGKTRTMNGEAQMTVPQSGIYLVKTGAQTFKVVL